MTDPILDESPRWGGRFWLIVIVAAVAVVGLTVHLLRGTLLDLLLGRMVIGSLGFVSPG